MKRIMKWMLAAILVCGTSVLTSCSPDNDDNPVAPTDEVEAQLQKMTLREKVGQLFYVRPECLDTTIHFNQPSSVDGSTDDIRAIKLQAVNETMRGELGYQNLIITDAMEMGAITQQYTNAEAAVGTLQAGADIVLGPQNFVKAFDAVVKAVEDGTLTEERINQSVRRILKLKKQAGHQTLL